MDIIQLTLIWKMNIWKMMSKVLVITLLMMGTLIACSNKKVEENVVPTTTTVPPSISTSALIPYYSPGRGSDDVDRELRYAGFSIISLLDENNEARQASSSYVVLSIDKAGEYVPVNQLITVRVTAKAKETTTPVVSSQDSFGEGVYLVGESMPPGVYTTTGGLDECYWARLKNQDGSPGAIIDNHLAKGPSRFTAKNGEFVEISRCTFTKK